MWKGDKIKRLLNNLKSKRIEPLMKQNSNSLNLNHYIRLKLTKQYNYVASSNKTDSQPNIKPSSVLNLVKSSHHRHNDSVFGSIPSNFEDSNGYSNEDSYSMNLRKIFGLIGSTLFGFLALKSKLSYSRQEHAKIKTQEDPSEAGNTQGELVRNSLKNRVSVISYAANDPIEDRYNAIQLKNLDGYLIEVLDGHGGFEVAEFASKKLHIYFDEKVKEVEGKDDDDKIIQAINYAFTSVEQDFLKLAKESYQNGQTKYIYVGACALLIIVHNNKVYVANCGDSKAKLFRKQDASYLPVKLSNTLNAGAKKEQNRLRSEYTDQDIFVCKKGSPKACYVKGRLQPTRSLGDFYLKHSEFNTETELVPSLRRKVRNFNGPYIKYLPEIKVYDLEKEDRYIVLATDGLWDELDGNDVANVIKDNNNKESILDGLFTSAILHAAQEAHMTFEDLLKVPNGRKKRSLHDDITVMVLDLKNQRN